MSLHLATALSKEIKFKILRGTRCETIYLSLRKVIWLFFACEKPFQFSSLASSSRHPKLREQRVHLFLGLMWKNRSGHTGQNLGSSLFTYTLVSDLTRNKVHSRICTAWPFPLFFPSQLLYTKLLGTRKTDICFVMCLLDLTAQISADNHIRCKRIFFRETHNVNMISVTICWRSNWDSCCVRWYMYFQGKLFFFCSQTPKTWALLWSRHTKSA